MPLPARGAGHADRRRAQDLEEAGPRGQDRRTGTGCGRRSCWLPPAAAPTRGSPRTCMSAWIWSASGGAGSPPGGLDGLRDLPRSGRPRRISAAERAAVVALACQLPAATGVPLSRWTGPELAAELAGPRPGRLHLGVLGPADPGRAPGQALAVPVLDLSPRPGLRRQGTGDPRPVPGVLPGQAAAARRPVHLLGRQAFHPGPRPLPPHRPARTRQARARRARIRHATAPSPCWPGSTCTPGKCSPPPRRPPGSRRSWTCRPGHGPPRVLQRAARVRHRGQRLRPPRPGRHRPAGHGPPERDHDPHAQCTRPG